MATCRTACLLLWLCAPLAWGCGGGASAAPKTPTGCSCEQLNDDCACLDGERLVRLVSLRASPAAGGGWSSPAFVLVGAPHTTSAVVFEASGVSGALELGWLDESKGGPLEVVSKRLQPRPAAGWLRVVDATAVEPFDLSVHAVVAQDDPSFARERWMEVHQQAIGGRPLNQLCLVGSHDAASYGINPLSAWASDWQTPQLNPRTAVRASRASETSILQQLLAGVRYLDLRVDFDAQGEPWMVHGLVGERASVVAGDVASFVAGHPRELVILDVQSVSGSAPDRHQRVVQLLELAVGDRLVDPTAITPTSTLSQVWARHEQVVLLLTGGPDALYLQHPLWRRAERLESLWGNVQEPAALEAHLDAALAARPADKLFVLQAQLTPDDLMAVAWGIRPEAATVDVPCADDPLDIGLCALARQTTPLVHQWVTGKWAAAPLNIVMVDYASLAPLVEACIAHDGG